MKLIIISTMSGFSWGGSEELWRDTALYAHNSGHEVEVITFEKKILHWKILELQEKGITIRFIKKLEAKVQSIWVRSLRRLLNKNQRPLYKNRFVFIEDSKADFILISQGGTTDISYIPDLKSLIDNITIPYAVLNQYHNEYAFLPNEQKEILKNFYQRASRIFFVAQRNREVFERQMAAHLHKAEIVKNPVNLSEQNVLKWPDEVIPRFAVVARLDIDYKGQDILLQTLSTGNWADRQFIVSLFGQGPHETYLNELIPFYGLEKKVFLSGHSNDIKDVWAKHHVLILPSHSEGMPLSLVEAMLCGRPCLVTDVGDSARMIDDNKTGWIANNASVKSIDEALERAWTQKSEWITMGFDAHVKAHDFIDPSPGKTLFEKLVNA